MESDTSWLQLGSSGTSWSFQLGNMEFGLIPCWQIEPFANWFEMESDHGQSIREWFIFMEWGGGGRGGMHVLLNWNAWTMHPHPQEYAWFAYLRPWIKYQMHDFNWNKIQVAFNWDKFKFFFPTRTWIQLLTGNWKIVPISVLQQLDIFNWKSQLVPFGKISSGFSSWVISNK